MTVFISQTKLTMLNKEGIIKPDDDGYYTLILGGMNVFNNSGTHCYVADGARELFAPGSILMRRVKNGALRAEVDHPTRLPGETMQAFEERYITVNTNNVCAHIADLWLDENFGKNHPKYDNPHLVAIMGKVKPVPPKGDVLKEQLENRRQNCCFSIRAFSREKIVEGRKIRILEDVFAFDLVNEGGILLASKWDSPATESIDNRFINAEDNIMPITKEVLERVMYGEASHMTSESTRELASYALGKYFSSNEQVQRAPIFRGWN